MNESDDPDHAEDEQRPGKTRTWWHPLLVRLLDFELAAAYKVQEEVLVGKLPLRVDIVLIRRESGQLPEANRRDLSVLLPLFRRFTLLEFKAPTDALQPGDLAQLAGCAFLWHSQQAERIPQQELSLIVLAPTINRAFRDELHCLGWEIGEHQKGVYRITGGPFTAWLVETDVMAELGDPILSLMSRVFLKDHRRIMEQLTQTGHPALLCYTLQQIEQFRKMGERFIMTHADTQYMNELEDELQIVLAGISPERRLRGLPPEDRLRGLSPKEVLRRFTPEQLAGGLTDEQAAQLRELLERGRDG
jgi:hypothetical protein